MASRLFSVLCLLLAASVMPAGAQPAPPSGSAALAAELALANRILADQSVFDAFGHVSVRLDANRFLLARSMAPALVTADDILVVDIATCAPAAPEKRGTYLERFIHCAIYRRDPDVNAVVHSHAPALIPFGVTRQPLKPVFHMGGFLGGGVPVFDIRASGGDATDLLIRDAKLGAALADALGDHAMVLMRGHGATMVGATLHQAVYRAIYAAENAKLEADALRLGAVTFLTDAEAKNAAATNDAQIDRAWELWRLSATRNALVK